MSQFTHADINRNAAVVIFSNTETLEKAAIALAFVDSMMVEESVMVIVTVGGAEYSVSADFWDDVSTWWADYLSGRLSHEAST